MSTSAFPAHELIPVMQVARNLPFGIFVALPGRYGWVLGGLTSALRAPNTVDPSGLPKTAAPPVFSSRTCSYRRKEQCRLDFPGQQMFGAFLPCSHEDGPAACEGRRGRALLP